jgi:hypothetical protein
MDKHNIYWEAATEALNIETNFRLKMSINIVYLSNPFNELFVII